MARLRHYVPSAFTAAGIAAAALSVQASVDGNYRSAAWLAMLCVLTDRLDGWVARGLNAVSAFGAQMDSFSDFFSFGIAPATVFYAFFKRTPSLGWTEGAASILLPVIVLFYVICVASRLARFNIYSVGGERFFWGVPTTFAGGVLCALFVMLLKYSDPALTATDPGMDHFYLVPGLRLDAVLALFPWFLLLFGVAMVSRFRMPKIGRTRWRVVDLVQGGGALVGFASALTRHLPEYLAFGAVVYSIGSIAYHVHSKRTNTTAHLPSLFDDVEKRELKAAEGM
jgi:CDP-diacylglycerol--serine O-phosphatidyltransferase